MHSHSGHLTHATAQPSKRGHVLISYPVRPQRIREQILIVLRIGPGTRHRAHIDKQGDPDALQQANEFIERPRAVTDGVERVPLRRISYCDALFTRPQTPFSSARGRNALSAGIVSRTLK